MTAHEPYLRVRAAMRTKEMEVVYIWRGMPVPTVDIITGMKWTLQYPAKVKLDLRRYEYLIPPISVPDDSMLSYALYAVHLALRACAQYLTADVVQFPACVLLSTTAQALCSSAAHKLNTEFYKLQFYGLDGSKKFKVVNLFYQAIRDILELYRTTLEYTFPDIKTSSAIYEDYLYNQMSKARPAKVRPRPR